jgi:ribose transport system substrate-binding protein
VIAAELSDFDAELSGVNANLDPGKQISDIETLVSQGIDVLLVNPVDPTALQDLIAGLEVPVVVQETSFGGPYFSNVTADIEDAVTQGANRLQELVGDEPVAAIIGPPFAEVLRRSAETFQAVAAEIGLNVVDVQTTQNPGSPDAAAEIASAWKVEYGDELAGIWTFNDTSAVGVASTVDDSFSPVLVSLNGQPEAIPLLEAGVIDYTYDIQQDMIARGLAYAAAAAICGESVPENIWIEPIELSPDDAGDWVNPAERGQEPLPTTLEERGDGRTFIVAAS